MKFHTQAVSQHRAKPSLGKVRSEVLQGTLLELQASVPHVFGADVVPFNPSEFTMNYCREAVSQRRAKPSLGKVRSVALQSVVLAACGAMMMSGAGYASTTVRLGIDNTASGSYSNAIGSGNTASENFSNALGRANIASGVQSSAVGHNNTASAELSNALGQGNMAQGYSSSAVGVGNRAEGHNSTAVGRGNTAGNGSAQVWSSTAETYVTRTGHNTAVGNDNTASGAYSTAIGQGNTASHHGNAGVASSNRSESLSGGGFNTAIGFRNTASNTLATAVGSRNTASGAFSSAMGDANTASGTWGSAIGSGNHATRTFGAAVGTFNSVSGRFGSAFGNWNSASGEKSSAFGYKNSATGARSSAFGYWAVADEDDLMVFGTADALFNYDAPRNATNYRLAGLSIRESAIPNLLSITPFMQPDIGPSNLELALYDYETAVRNAAVKTHRDNAPDRKLVVDGHGNLSAVADISVDNATAIGNRNDTGANTNEASLFARVNYLDTRVDGIDYTGQGSDSIALGGSALKYKVTGNNAIAIGDRTGFNTEARGSHSVSVGSGSRANADFGIAIGRDAEVGVANRSDSDPSAYGSIAIGYKSQATHRRSSAFGFEAKTRADNEMVFGHAWQTGTSLNRMQHATSYRFAGLGCPTGTGNITCTGGRKKGVVIVDSDGVLDVHSATTDGYLKLRADGTLVSVAAIPQTDLEGANGMLGTTNPNPPVTPLANEGGGTGGNSGGTVANTLGSASFGTTATGLASGVGDAAAFTDFSARVESNVAAISAHDSRIETNAAAITQTNTAMANMEQRLTERADNMDQRLTERAETNAQGVALSNALASLPKALLPGERLRLGIGVGSFDGKSGTAIGIMGKFGASTLLNAGFSTGGGESSTQVGISWGW